MTFVYPTEEDLRIFTSILKTGKYKISKYLPHTDEEWITIINDAVRYVEHTSQYHDETSATVCCARLMYKIAKRHELHDGNKRSAVIVGYIFLILNDYGIKDAPTLKQEAIRAARSKGRGNEAMICKRIASSLDAVVVKLPPMSEE